jgi:ABC-type nitrate/sulfonate/bicarbonate transport system ATPase subunit
MYYLLDKELLANSYGSRNRHRYAEKVSFAAAVIHRFQILFLEEPFENVDPGTVTNMKRWLKHLWEKEQRFSAAMC